jgi:hypothetical protein
MSWAAHAKAELSAGRPVTVRPRGGSMHPKVRSGAEVDLAPISDPASLKVGDIVLVRVAGNDYLHLISAADAKRVQISNNRGRINGWVPRDKVFGLAVAVRN